MAENPAKELKNRLLGAAKIAVLGIGSRLKGDDAGGVIAAEDLRGALSKNFEKLNVGIFIGGTAPENVTSEIKRFKPSHLIIVDAADMTGEPRDI